MKKTLVINPTKEFGGVKQASLYLYFYLNKFFNTKLISFMDGENEFCIFKRLLKEFSICKPDMIFVHEVVNSKVYNYLKVIFPDIRLAFFTLCSQGLESTNYSMFDYYIGPNANNSDVPKHKIEMQKIDFMFNFPKVFNEKIDYDKRSNDLLFIGKIEEHKINENFFNAVKRNAKPKMILYGKKKYDENSYLNMIDKCYSFVVNDPLPSLELPKIYNQFKYLVVPSDCECFSLAAVEATLCGCIPITIKTTHNGLRWANPLTPQFRNHNDLYDIWSFFESMPKESLELYRKEHRKKVIEYIDKYSDISIIQNLLGKQAPTAGYINKEL